MSLSPPPEDQPAGTPAVETLSAGARLVRVHGDHPAEAFNPTPQPSRLRSGRFDSLDGEYASTCLGRDGRAVVAAPGWPSSWRCCGSTTRRWREGRAAEGYLAGRGPQRVVVVERTSTSHTLAAAAASRASPVTRRHPSTSASAT